MKIHAAAITLFALLPASLLSQSLADRALLAEIRTIRAIDNHSHIPPVTPTGAVISTNDPIGATPFPYPVRLRVDNHEWIRAWRELYEVKIGNMTADGVAAMLQRKRALERARGEKWPAWILDKVAIDSTLVNAPALGAGQKSPRFLWVPTCDSLLFPFGGIEANPEVGAMRLPATLDVYEREMIAGTFARWRRDGAVAVKLSVAYGRSLDFAEVSPTEAAVIYARHAATGVAPAPADYKALQDHLFRIVAREAGKAGLVVHIHTGIGADPYFHIAGANPLLLEPALNDPTLRSTQFVLIHGGWPFDRQAGAMLIKPNVYADFSAHTFLQSKRALSEMLRAWLEWYPEKVLFGTDAYLDPATPSSGWEEKLWLSNDTAREALALALTGMMNDGDITRGRASELARMVLRENAIRLYRFK